MALEQLRPNGARALELLFEDLDEAEQIAHDDPVTTKKLLRRIRKRLMEEIRPMLERAPDKNAKLTLEARMAALEAEMRQLREQS